MGCTVMLFQQTHRPELSLKSPGGNAAKLQQSTHLLEGRLRGRVNCGVVVDQGGGLGLGRWEGTVCRCGDALPVDSEQD